MGQAKKRGSLAERIEQSKAKDANDRLARQRLEDDLRRKERERWDAMTDEQKAAERSRREQRARRLAMVAAWTGAMGAFGRW